MEMAGRKQTRKRRRNRSEVKLSPLPSQSMQEGVIILPGVLHSLHDDRAAKEVNIRPTLKDFVSDDAVWALYHRWCLLYNIHRTPEEMGKRFNKFKKSAHEVYEMNQMDSLCQFHLSFVCDEKDLFDGSGDEDFDLTERDLQSNEAVLDLYYRWCLYYNIRRTPEEMQERVKNFKMSATRAVEMNEKDLSCLSIWCDKIELRYWSDAEDMTLTPTKRDLESDNALLDLYHRWCIRHKIHRTSEEMQMRFDIFKKSVTHVFEMSQKDCTMQYRLSFGCDELDLPFPAVKVVPTERDLKSGNALLGLYHRYCLYYKKHWTTELEEMKQRFNIFKTCVNYVFEKNKEDPSCLYIPSDYCDEEVFFDDRLVNPAGPAIRPTASDFESEEAVWALYCRCNLFFKMGRTREEMIARLDTFRKNAGVALTMNLRCPNIAAMPPWCDETPPVLGCCIFDDDDEE